MTSAIGSDGKARRRHDAQASRDALLAAAAALFEARGFDATTVREIGERADVDPALIVRYFGGKEGLYLATLSASERPAGSDDPQETFARIVRRSETRGVGPVALAMASPTLTDAMRAQVREIIAARAVDPVAGTLDARGTPDARLRAELLVATALGLTLTRAAGTLPALADAAPETLLAVMAPLIEALCEPQR